MGKARSFRLTPENEARLQDIQEQMGLDNPNLTFNNIIENYAEYLKLRPLLIHLEALIEGIIYIQKL